VAAGKSNQQIADELFITANTVANHVKNILSKTQSDNRTEAAAYASSRGLA
jgi:DNA-binding NarL/FixJ family response regulator